MELYVQVYSAKLDTLVFVANCFEQKVYELERIKINNLFFEPTETLSKHSFVLSVRKLCVLYYSNTHYLISSYPLLGALRRDL